MKEILKQIPVIRDMQNISNHFEDFYSVSFVRWEPEKAILETEQSGGIVKIKKGSLFKTSEDFKVRCVNYPLAVVIISLKME